MIGQEKLRNKVKSLIQNGWYPRFSILVGLKGSGKKVMANYIAKQIGGNIIVVDTKVDAIREMIDQAYKIATTTVFIIADADTMSEQAKNALLKVTEEPPNNAYFIMTLQSLDNTLATIRSRGTAFDMDIYTPKDIMMLTGLSMPNDIINMYVELCETPLEVKLLLDYDIDEFNNYVKLVIDNIAVVSGSNSFKIADKIAFNDESDKYDLQLFWKAFQCMCWKTMAFKEDKTANDVMMCMDGVEVTNKYRNDMRVNTLNKQTLFDMWILDIRKRWMKYADD